MDQLVKVHKTAKNFIKGLLYWNKILNKRQMPWKGEKDPYKIWLSEIILQQTRVEQGLGYYQRFIQTFPTIDHLASAPEQQVFKLWEGLGYYSRCKNLIATARLIANESNGVFPSSYESILALKGIGPYTAAAIASFAYNQHHAVLDGNVFRVLSRIFDIAVPVDSAKGKKLFASIAQTLLPQNQSAIYNQAIMDFGATICKPVPECPKCFFRQQCSAFLMDKQQALPVKEKKVTVKKRWLNYVVIKQENWFAIKQRTKKDIWQNLYEFPLVETDKKSSAKDILARVQKDYGISLKNIKTTYSPERLEQRLSHQLIYFHFITAEVLSKALMDSSFLWIEASNLRHYPFPKTLQKYISLHI